LKEPFQRIHGTIYFFEELIPRARNSGFAGVILFVWLITAVAVTSKAKLLFQN
jgi:hypothetical protein